jgi:hypothetical protein
MKAKFINEAIGDVLKPKSQENILKDLGKHGSVYAEITNNPIYKQLTDLGFTMVSSMRQLENGTVKFETATPIMLKRTPTTDISFRLEDGGYFRVNGKPLYKWDKKPTIQEALEYAIDWIKNPKKIQIHGEEKEFKIKTDETFIKLGQAHKEWENKLKTLKGKRMTGRMEWYGNEWYGNPRRTDQENRLWVQDIFVKEDNIFVKNGDYYFKLLPNVTYTIHES